MKLSDREHALLALLPSDGTPVSTRELVQQYWATDDEPFNARGIIGTRMRSIMRKLDHTRDKRRVLKSERRGPQPISFWVKRR